MGQLNSFAHAKMHKYHDSSSQSTHEFDESDEVPEEDIGSNSNDANDGINVVFDDNCISQPTPTIEDSRSSSTSNGVSIAELSKRWAPMGKKQNSSHNRRASPGKMVTSRTSILSNLRRRSSTSNEHSNSFTSTLVNECRSHNENLLSQTNHESNLPSRNRSDSIQEDDAERFTVPSKYDIIESDNSELALILHEMKEDSNFKRSLKEGKSQDPSTHLVPPDHTKLRRPSRRPSIVSSVSSVESFSDNNDLDLQAGAPAMDTKSMLAKLGPRPTSRDLTNVAAVRASEYINECLVKGQESELFDRKKWDMIPQYAKSDLIIQKHLGKGTFSDAFEVIATVAVEKHTEAKAFDKPDKDTLDRLLEAKFNGSFESCSRKNERKVESLVHKKLSEKQEDEDEGDDLDRQIDALFGGTFKEPIKKVEPSASPPARVPNTGTRRVLNRRQTADHGVTASICVGSLDRISETAGPVKMKKMTYAMKCLRPQIRQDAEQFLVGVEDLVNETRMLASLEHENIIKLHGRAGCGLRTFHLSDGYFILLDRLQDTLEDRIGAWKVKQGGSTVVPSLSQVKAAYAVADALSYLHSKDVIFRDLKPTNVGFDSKGILKLFDFGFATTVRTNSEEDEVSPDDIAPSPKHKLLHEVCGTPRYMAGEVAMIMGYSLPADVYSFGILLWEICSLKKPFAKIKTHDEFQRTVHEKGGRPKLSRYWPPVLKDTMQSCWSRFPGDRPSMEFVKNSLGVHVRELMEVQKQQKTGQRTSDALRMSSVFRRLTG